MASLLRLTTALRPLHMIKGRIGIKVNRLAEKRGDYYLFIILEKDHLPMVDDER